MRCEKLSNLCSVISTLRFWILALRRRKLVISDANQTNSSFNQRWQMDSKLKKFRPFSIPKKPTMCANPAKHPRIWIFEHISWERLGRDIAERDWAQLVRMSHLTNFRWNRRYSMAPGFSPICFCFVQNFCRGSRFLQQQQLNFCLQPKRGLLFLIQGKQIIFLPLEVFNPSARSAASSPWFERRAEFSVETLALLYLCFLLFVSIQAKIWQRCWSIKQGFSLWRHCFS